MHDNTTERQSVTERESGQQRVQKMKQPSRERAYTVKNG